MYSRISVVLVAIIVGVAGIAQAQTSGGSAPVSRGFTPPPAVQQRPVTAPQNIAPKNVGPSFNTGTTGSTGPQAPNRGFTASPGVGTSNVGTSFNRGPAVANPSQPIAQGQPAPVQRTAPSPRIHVQNTTNLPKPPTLTPTINATQPPNSLKTPSNEHALGYRPPPPRQPITQPANAGPSLAPGQPPNKLLAPPSSVQPTVSAETMKNLTAPTTAKAPAAVNTATPVTATTPTPNPAVKSLQGVDLTRYNTYIKMGHSEATALGLVKVFSDLDARNPQQPAATSVAPASTTPAPATSAPVATSAPTPVAATPAPVVSAPAPAPQEKTTVQMAGSGTQFKMNKVGTDKYTFEVVGSNKGDRFLDGVKKDGSDVGLGTQGGNGTVWKVHDEKGGKVRLECVSCSGNDKYLDGSRSAGADQLGLAIKSNSGTLWKMNKSSNGTVTFECAEKDSGPKLLSMKTDIINPPPSAPAAVAATPVPAPVVATPAATPAPAPAPIVSAPCAYASRCNSCASGICARSSAPGKDHHSDGRFWHTVQDE